MQNPKTPNFRQYSFFYSLFSAIIFISIFLKICARNNFQFYETLRAIYIEDFLIFSFSVYNFYISLLVFLYSELRYFICDEYLIYVKLEFNHFILGSIFAIFTLLNLFTANKSALFYLPLITFFCLVAFVSNTMVSLFIQISSKISKRIHKRVFIFNIILILLLLKLWSVIDKSDVFSNVYLYLLLGIIFTTITTIGNHIIYIFDISNYGNSFETPKNMFHMEARSNVIELLLDVLILVQIFIQKDAPLLFSISSVLYISSRIIFLQSLYFYYNCSQRSRDSIMLFPNANSADLLNQDTCIICRNKMTIKTAKRLQCHHCIHLVCLAKWIEYQNKCPLCQNKIFVISSSKKHKITPYLFNHIYLLKHLKILKMHKFFDESSFRNLYNEMLISYSALLKEKDFLCKQQKELEKMAKSGLNWTSNEIRETEEFIQQVSSLILKYQKNFKYFDKKNIKQIINRTS
ncbi:hypothetical protein TRFO_31264 [Tritrichomonas foetus]|uniref:RING-type domain-containing protein n=1 Tax=Tritrichomonas foetus TaxID=1144522 RepID=A0A1J4JW84_9EUKA|nr:hypothetical protein TRFO_31264 [Tritrichomonas foetus]|eukprot:OHT01788.1 hypothetical protein TRFO_31264 [Tritrichomonas foetus]